jgi:polysaccharide pyruvyl transferase WcaK-like protein
LITNHDKYKRKPFTICLWGAWYGSKNTGDQAMLIAITRLLQKREENVKIVVLSENAQYIKTYMNQEGLEIDALNKWKQFPKMLLNLIRANLFCVGGGVPFYDNLSHIVVFIILVTLSKLCRVKIMTYAPSTQKLKHPFARWIYRVFLNRFDLITLREAWSVNQFKQLGIRKKIVFTADPAIGLEPAAPTRIDEILQKEGLNRDRSKPLIGITTRRLRANLKRTGAHYRKTNKQEIENFKNIVAKAADHLSTIGQVVFIPMNTASFDDDRVMAKGIVNKMRRGSNAHIMVNKYTAPEMLGVFSRCSFVLANRVHSIIFAATCSVPFVSIAYDFKFIGITERFNLVENNFDLVGINEQPVIDKINMVWNDRKIITERLEKRIKELKKLVELNADLAIILCRNHPIDYSKLHDYIV